MTQGELVQVIDGQGQFQTEAVQNFVAQHGLVAAKTDYQVVAIMGPQSSGKSTLLNHVFGTKFQEMDAERGRSQTTKGVWLSLSPKVTEAATMVMDLEGSDGRERGEDDVNFERQTALFALAVADVLLVNVWCHDIGREHASGKPLMKTILQVNLKLFAPEPNRRRTVLLFVLRDKTKTPLPRLVETLQADLQAMWAGLSKPPQYEQSALTDFFEVQYSGLSHFEERHEDFLADAVVLRRRFEPQGEGSLVRPDNAQGKLPAGALALSLDRMWGAIRSQVDLNLPAHKLMVANVRCEAIKGEQLAGFSAEQGAWGQLASQAAQGLVPGFGAGAAELVEACLRGYRQEALYFDATVRAQREAELLAALHGLVQPVAQAQLQRLHDTLLADFERELEAAAATAKGKSPGFAALAAEAQAAALLRFHKAVEADIAVPGLEGWPGAEAAAAMEAALAGAVAAVKGAKVAGELARTDKALGGLLSASIVGLLEGCPPGLWPKLQAVCRDAVAGGEQQLLERLEGWGLSDGEVARLRASLVEYAQAKLEAHVREAALTRLSRMKERFQAAFSTDGANGMPRMWGPCDDVAAAAQLARQVAANVLVQLAVVRSRPKEGRAAAEAAVEAAILRLTASVDPGAAAGAGEAEQASSRQHGSPASSPGGGSLDATTLAAWPGIPAAAVLITPAEARTSWREFLSASNMLVQQALATQQANRLASSRPVPLWALLALLFLGWNELMAVVFNPFYLALAVAALLFLRTLYVEMDVDGELAKGALPGALALSRKLGPCTRSVTSRTLEAVRGLLSSSVASEGQQLDEQPGRGAQRGSSSKAAADKKRD